LTSLSVGSLLNYFFRMPLMDNIISGAMAVVFATYLAYDTQKIVGGKHHKHAYSPKEYILAALNLYQDIISLFMQIVSILNKMEKSNKRKRSS
jgi:FtsH-binding integral membrane protein